MSQLTHLHIPYKSTISKELKLWCWIIHTFCLFFPLKFQTHHLCKFNLTSTIGGDNALKELLAIKQEEDVTSGIVSASDVTTVSWTSDAYGSLFWKYKLGGIDFLLCCDYDLQKL